MAIHQCARFCSDPILSYERALQKIVRYLIQTKDKGLRCRVDQTKGIELLVDANFAGE